MAGNLRYWKEEDGRFFARIAVPAQLRPFLDRPRGELIEALGDGRRAVLRLHPAAVARLQHEISIAATKANRGGTRPLPPAPPFTPISTTDHSRAVWHPYSEALAADDAARERLPDAAKVAAERQKLAAMADAGEFANPLAALDASFDYLLLKEARTPDQFAREARLAALKRELSQGATHQVQHEVDAYLARHGMTAKEGSAERAVLAKRMLRAEIEALQRALERDQGNYGGRPTDPVVTPPPTDDVEPASLSQLWSDDIKGRVQAGFLKDGGKRQEPVIRHLRTFLKHDNAQRVTSKDLIAWRDHLLGIDKLAAKTVSDIYLSTVRSLFKWAHENERLPVNIAEKVRQSKPRKVDSREKGYTDTEAVAVLRASRSHVPKANQFAYIKETGHMTAAKRWAPLLAAFSGARISEVTQLRKEDIRKEGDRWIARITPEAGTVKSGGYRDVPLHKRAVLHQWSEGIHLANSAR